MCHFLDHPVYISFFVTSFRPSHATNETTKKQVLSIGTTTFFTTAKVFQTVLYMGNDFNNDFLEKSLWKSLKCARAFILIFVFYTKLNIKLVIIQRSALNCTCASRKKVNNMKNVILVHSMNPSCNMSSIAYKEDPLQVIVNR